MKKILFLVLWIMALGTAEALAAQYVIKDDLRFEIIDGYAYIVDHPSYYQTWYNPDQREVTVPATVTYQETEYQVKGFYFRVKDGYGYWDYDYYFIFPRILNLPASCDEVVYEINMSYTHDHSQKISRYPLIKFITEVIWKDWSMDEWGWGWKNLQINFEPGNGLYSSLDGVVYNSDGTQLIYVPLTYTGELRIPSYLNSIASKAAKGRDITAVHLLSSASENASLSAPANELEIDTTPCAIEKGAFEDCKLLTEVEIPNNIKEIGENAFKGCSALTKVTLSSIDKIAMSAFQGTDLREFVVPESSTALESSQGVLFTKGLERLIVSPNNISSLALPAATRQIEAYAFCNNKSPLSLTLNEGLQTIGEYAFNGNTISDLQIPSSLVEMGKSAFANVSFSENQSLVIPASLKDISSNAFANTNLRSLRLCEGVRCVGDSAFFKTGISDLILNNDLERLGTRAFAENSELKSVVIPESVTYFGDYIFAFKEYVDCERVVTFPSNMKRIPVGMFAGNGLRSFVWPENVEVLSDYCFYNASIDSSVLEIPPTVKKIGAYSLSTFVNGTETNTLDKLIMYGVQNISSFAFFWAQPAEVYCISWTPPVCGRDAFSPKVRQSATLYVPNGAQETYYRAREWSDFAYIEHPEFDGVEEVAADADKAVSINGDALTIEIAPEVEVAVYATDGRLIYSGYGACSLTPGRGIFIVRIGTRTCKVIL